MSCNSLVLFFGFIGLLSIILYTPAKAAFRDYLDGTSSRIVVIGLAIFGSLLLFVPLTITKLSLISFDYDNTGEIGDIIGGTTAPFIGFAGIIVTFYAFWVQYQSNLHQRKDIRLERFENQFYEMLKMHKDNVSEMEIDNQIRGRKCFVRMFDEFKYIYLLTFQLYRLNKTNLDKEYTIDKLCDIAYKIFFAGLTSLSDIELNRRIDKSDNVFLLIIREKLALTENKWNSNFKSLGTVEQTVFLEDSVDKFTFEMFYYPFDGHNVRLGHYYRHLYQTVSLVVDSEIVAERADKYKYLKLLRAQLSNHEQALLYYNGLTTFGEAWISKGYFRNYKMIKNIPFDIANFGTLPWKKISSPNDYGEKVFEWE